jgi:ribosomal-protein-alanine N-acetyltransferase
MSDLQLTTERLVLRRMTLGDAPALHPTFSDPEAMRFWSTLPHESLAVTEAWVAATIASVIAGEADDFAVVLNGAVIGKAGLWKGKEIGVILSRGAWGRGLATEALRAAINHGFSQGIDCITADIDPRNLSSQRLFRKLGFRHTGSEKATFLIGEEWADSDFFALTAGDWSAVRS